MSLKVFNTFNITAEDLDKTAKYEVEQKRKKLRNESLSYEDFLLTLDINCIVNEAEIIEMQRITQLLSKTNQFNFTTKRYSESEVRKFMEDPKVKVLTLHVSDKFGAYGLVGVVILINDKENAIIDTFLLSQSIRKES